MLRKTITYCLLLVFLTVTAIAKDGGKKDQVICKYENGNTQVIYTKYHKSLIKIERFYENGNLMTTGFIKDGKNHGRWLRYNENGSLHSEAYFIESRKVGEWLVYNEEAQKSQSLKFADNQVSQITHFGPQGEVLSIIER